MASYTVRIELKEQTEKAHIEMMFAMLENGFSRSVVCRRGFTYALPTDEFVYVGSEKITDLMSRVCTLLSSFSEALVVLITGAGERCWSGLRVINLE
ncbi:hypothetical protein SB719_05785 [Pantoea sp. SIMBA_079]|jgi:hypothetical protein|uniref:hypothetical protein n=1 Tax=Pantoea sp. SIMBA_079 TaxID=3085817 RepID=UPI0028DBF213|nr:hypothetical protein [uncultured Pantoea sp.]